MTLAMASVVAATLVWFGLDAMRRPHAQPLAYASLQLNPAKLDADGLVARVKRHARRWKFDAAWWSMDLRRVRSDATIDVTRLGTASLVFVSPSRVQSTDPQRRQDAMRRYVFGREAIAVSARIGVRQRWKSIYVPPRPECTIARLVRALRVRGLTPAHTIDVSFDPRWAYGTEAPSELSWRVRSQLRALNGWFSMASCQLTRALSPERS